MTRILFFFGSICFFSACQESIDDLISKADKQDCPEAIKIYDEILKRNSKIQLVLYNRGLCYFQLKNYRNALQDFNWAFNLKKRGNAVIDFNPSMPQADLETRTQVPFLDILYQRGQVKFYLDSINSGFKDFQICIDNDFETSNCLVWQGALFLRSRQNAQACMVFQRAKQLAKDSSDLNDAEKMIREYCLTNNPKNSISKPTIIK